MSTICQVCKIPLAHHVHCKQCTMVSYCSVEHLTEDADGHQPLCKAIQEIAKKRGGHVYNNARILNDDDYRSLRVHTLNLCENALQRHLQPFEREILLFPRLCATGTCREWRQQLLTECKSCGQVGCRTEGVLVTIVGENTETNICLPSGFILCRARQPSGRQPRTLVPSVCAVPEARFHAEKVRPHRTVAAVQDHDEAVPAAGHHGRNVQKPVQELWRLVRRFSCVMCERSFRIPHPSPIRTAIKEDCTYAALTQLATAPLTAYYGMQRADMTSPIGERFTIHLVGAELQFEADTLDKWETFFLHLVPQLLELHVTFVGPELNAENLPLEILSRIR